MDYIYEGLVSAGIIVSDNQYSIFSLSGKNNFSQQREDGSVFQGDKEKLL